MNDCSNPDRAGCFHISSVEEASRAINYFNSFHDGFIQRIEIVSQDWVEPGKWSSVSTGFFDVVLLIAHYNYDEGRPPYNQAIRCVFRDVDRICLDFFEVKWEWDIYDVEIREAGGRLSCVFRRNHLVDDAWVIREHRLFDFETADMMEELTSFKVPDWCDDQ